MPTIVSIGGYYIYFTVKCLKEPIHIHFNIGKPADDGKSAKIWLLSNGDLREEHRGIFAEDKNEKMFQKLCEIAYENRDKLELLWQEKAGAITYIDVVGYFNVMQND